MRTGEEDEDGGVGAGAQETELIGWVRKWKAAHRTVRLKDEGAIWPLGMALGMHPSSSRIYVKPGLCH